MSTPAFLDTLRSEVARMQVTHPEREAELARAHALLMLGMVTPSPEDPAMGQVLSSDGQKVYHVNGTCDCDAGQHGRGCKHVHGWRLYQYVQRKVEAQTAPELPHPQGEDAQICASSSAPPPLPEAPASANVRVQIAGREVQITLRDTDEARLLVRLQTLLEQFPVPKPPVESTEGFQGRQSPQANGQKGFCALHGVQMKLNDKNGRQWWSHRLPDDQGWCKGGRR